MSTPEEISDGGMVQDDSPGPNPAWNEVLSVLPEQFHSVVTPHFQKWDQAANSRVEAVNSQLKDFEVYQPFVEHGITPDIIEQGLRIMWEVNNNPQNVYNSLASTYGYNQSQQNSSTGEENDESNSPDPYENKFNELNQGLELVSKIVLADAQAKRDAAADTELNNELSALKEKIGDYDERFVLSMMQNGMSAEEAGQAFIDLKSNISQQRPSAPRILSGNNGGGSGLPSQAIDPTKLSSKETRNLVAEMLARASQQ
jgi:hypothetical protein